MTIREAHLADRLTLESLSLFLALNKQAAMNPYSKIIKPMWFKLQRSDQLRAWRV